MGNYCLSKDMLKVQIFRKTVVPKIEAPALLMSTVCLFVSSFWEGWAGTVTLAVLELILLQPKCWDHKHVPLCLASSHSCF